MGQKSNRHTTKFSCEMQGLSQLAVFANAQTYIATM